MTLHDPRLAPLLEGLAFEYETRYGPGDEMSAVHHDEFLPPAGLFLALFADGMLVAGGGFRRLTAQVCEVKRMWTHPDRRRRGLASVVLAALEDRARAAGYTTLRLETGPAQPEAEAMYTARGYRRIAAYGRYDVALAFEVDLTVPRRRAPDISSG